jgi:uncharacterized small protein (DUF1192 family)
MTGCASVGLSPGEDISIIKRTGEPFERGLMLYVRGDLEGARRALMEALKNAPHDLRARDLLQAIQRERGKVGNPQLMEEDEWGNVLPKVGEIRPERLLQWISYRSPRIREALFRVVEARGRLLEADLSLSPQFDLLTRFYPAGILASLTQSILSALIRRKYLMHQAEMDLLQALSNYIQVQEETLARGARAWLDAMEARALLAAMEEERRIRSRQVDLLRRLQREGLRSWEELFLRQWEMGELEAAILNQMARERMSLGVLKALLGIEGQDTLEVMNASIKLDRLLELNLDQLKARARKMRAEIKRTEAALRRAKTQRDASAFSLWDLGIRTTYGNSVDEGRGDF